MDPPWWFHMVTCDFSRFWTPSPSDPTTASSMAHGDNSETSAWQTHRRNLYPWVVLIGSWRDPYIGLLKSPEYKVCSIILYIKNNSLGFLLNTAQLRWQQNKSGPFEDVSPIFPIGDFSCHVSSPESRWNSRSFEMRVPMARHHQDDSVWLSEPRKKQLLLFITVYWLFKRGPENVF